MFPNHFDNKVFHTNRCLYRLSRHVLCGGAQCPGLRNSPLYAECPLQRHGKVVTELGLRLCLTSKIENNPMEIMASPWRQSGEEELASPFCTEQTEPPLSKGVGMRAEGKGGLEAASKAVMIWVLGQRCWTARGSVRALCRTEEEGLKKARL